MPVIAKSISHHISFLADFGARDRVASIAESFYLVFGLVIPEVDDAVGACGHEPAIIDGVEGNAVDWVQDSVSGLLVFVALKGDDVFLNRDLSTGEYWPFTFLLMLERLALPSKEATPRAVHFWLIATV